MKTRLLPFIAIILILSGCATTSTKPESLSPTLQNFIKLQDEVLDGNLKAIDEIAKLKEKLYAGIDYKKDEERLKSNLKIIRATFMPIGEAAGEGSQAASDALIYALKIRPLKGSATYALGAAAEKGHEPSLEILLNYKDHNLLLSSTVGAMRYIGGSMPKKVVVFLSKTHREHSGLSHMTSKALYVAARQGNKDARLALKDAAGTGEKYAVRYYDRL